MSGTISPRDRLQLWVNTFLLKQKENSGSVTATFREMVTIFDMDLRKHRVSDQFFARDLLRHRWFNCVPNLKARLLLPQFQCHCH